ncbi:trypsin-like peptidase domain-containing protein [Streptomyces paradoxus]|uniref:VMAP-C domain-containing protein n=1 Tax=Streptomyces paradoxus TaxID=66375 RepID=UPI003701FE66
MRRGTGDADRPGGGKEAGAAVLLSPRQVLTCAHVVNDALHVRLLTADRPDAEGLGVVFHTADTPRRTVARVTVWVPPRRMPSGVWHGDLCVLELTEPAPEQAQPAVWREMAEGQAVRAFGPDGKAGGFADTEVKLADEGIYYLDGELSGAAISPGFSGGPLWCRHDPAVVGLVVAHREMHGPVTGQQVVRRSWALPWQTIRAELLAAGASDLIERYPARDPIAADPARETLGRALWDLLGDPLARADHARRLADQLGYHPPADASAPGVEELADLLITADRALATLTESLASAHPGSRRPQALDRLLAAGRLSDTARLLSVGEHRTLIGKLKQAATNDPVLLPRAAREALRYTTLPAALRGARLSPQDVKAALGELEALPDGDLPDGGPSVPALLKLVEFTAAALPDPHREELRTWSWSVSRRLGVHQAALGQRRADAAAWAARQPTAVTRIVAQIRSFASDPPGQHRCSLWQVREDGTPVPVFTEESEPATTDRIGRLIRQAAERAELESGHEVKDVDILVDREGLHLPVDEWDAGNAIEWLPGVPLGVGHRVVLRCPDITGHNPRHAHMLRARLSDADAAGPLVVDEKTADPKQLYSLLRTSHEYTGQVVLHGPVLVRKILLEICLACGVPVILWDRAAQSHADARHLDEVAPHGPLFQLPEQVRTFRGRIWADPERHRARPSLVWEPKEPLPLPSRHRLTDPAEGAQTR